MSQHLLAVDQGTTGTTVLVVRSDGTVVSRGYREHPQHFPRPGWVEHDPRAIWQTVLDCTDEALTAGGVAPGEIAGVGITNQRETVVAWDATTGEPVGPTIVWQDRRTADMCEQLREEGFDESIRAITGLPTDPYFSGTKVAWLLEHDADVRRAASAGTLRLGTIDSWLIWNMSAGAVHVTDASNAARTLLYDIHAGDWSDTLLARFDVDPSWLPRVVDSAGTCATCVPAAYCGLSAPVAGIAGDQQSALFGQACLTPGTAKATYGTGAFVLVNSGTLAPVSERLISTIAWRLDESLTYALEGSIFTAGASVQWLRDGLQILPDAPAIEQLASSVPDSGGVVLVPAFAGLGAPMWDAQARASLLGVTRGTTRAHVARATLEAIAFRVRQLVEAMRAEGTDVTELRVDGGMANNDTFLQMQADVLDIPVTRPVNVETTSLGAAFLAGLGCGIHATLDDVAAAWHADRTFEPAAKRGWVEPAWRRFEHAVEVTRSFAPVTQG